MESIGDDMMVFSIFNVYRHMGIPEESIVRIPQSQLRTYDGPEVLLPVNFPFYGVFALSPKIHPVFLSISVLHASVAEHMHLRQYEPIGCRDIYTYQTLKAAGVDAYLNGCLTLALPKRRLGQNRDKVFFIDIPDSLRPHIPAHLLENAVFDTQNYYDEQAMGADETFTKARYEQYVDQAKLVVTSRLHCATPCAAAGLPTILASEKKSFRYNWLENVMPVYTAEHFAEIDWEPEPLEFEKEKKLLLDHAASRVWAEYHRLVSRPLIHALYYNEFADHSPESTRNALAYLEANWRPEEEHSYVLWGVTQTAELIYDHITANYPKAKLAGVIDLYHKQMFHGVETGGLELLEDLRTPVFVTVEAANEQALRLFAEQRREEYVICWTNPRTKKEKQ